MKTDIRIGGRSLGKIAQALGRRQHYRALIGMVRTCPSFPQLLSRYLLGSGTYPWSVALRTPIGGVAPTLYVPDDVLTLNEIFCREDYPAGPELGVVVDLGSNIGLSALYFLTRNAQSRCYLFEPVPRNRDRLRANLAGFEGRYALREEAVAAESGEVEFGVEGTGRYGGIRRPTGAMIRVRCRHINDVLEEILRTEGRIDIVKIDTEGQEANTIAAIDPSLMGRINRLFAELGNRETVVVPSGFSATRYGTTLHLVNRLA